MLMGLLPTLLMPPQVFSKTRFLLVCCMVKIKLKTFYFRGKLHLHFSALSTAGMKTMLCPVWFDIALPLLFMIQGISGCFPVAWEVHTQSSDAKLTSFHGLNSCNGANMPGSPSANLHIFWTH